jgi:EpsI family protein
MMDILQGRLSGHFVVTIVLLGATLAASQVTSDRKAEPLLAPLSTIPLQIGSFTGGENPSLPAGVLNELKATDYISRTYRQTDLDADLFIAFYSRQRAGQSMHSPKHCLPGSGWEIWDYATMSLPIENQRVTINKYSISHAGDRKVVLYWYQSKDRVFASEYLGKLLLGRDSLLKNTTAAAIVRIIIPDKPGAVEGTSAFASGVISQMHRLF